MTYNFITKEHLLVMSASNDFFFRVFSALRHNLVALFKDD